MSNFNVRVLADSLGPLGDRLTTLELTYPRFIHAELMTHRVLSRNSASSRAIPAAKLIGTIESDPVVPILWGKNEPGMQANAEVDDKAGAERWWRDGITKVVEHAKAGIQLGLHKQIVNRFLEVGMKITVIVSSTTWTNFIGLRLHSAAEPHFQKLASMVKDALEASQPQFLGKGKWHLPLIDTKDRQIVAQHVLSEKGYTNPYRLQSGVDARLCQIAVGRCARVSYLTHDGNRDHNADVELHDKLMVSEPLHASPAEHIAQALFWPEWFTQKHQGLCLLPSHQINVLRQEYREILADPLHRFQNNEEITSQSIEEMTAVEAALSQIQSGNFRGFRQYRKTKSSEHIGEFMP